MKFGIREICDVVFKAKTDMYVGKTLFTKGQPVLYIDTAKTSTLEGAATTVYAQGGRGNTRLIAWEGEKTVTFTVEDALLSPIGFSILSGAGLFKADDDTTEVHVHKTATTTIEKSGEDKIVDLTSALEDNEGICSKAPIFILKAESDGSVTGDIIKGDVTGDDELKKTLKITDTSAAVGDMVFVDFYVTKKSSVVSELQITADSFSGNFYVEASTLFRDQATGRDMPAELTFPNVKIQSNFNFQMAATGDPSTFSFVMDAFPDYTIFSKKKKVLVAIQVIEETVTPDAGRDTLFPHDKETEEVNAYQKTDKHEYYADTTKYQIGYIDSNFAVSADTKSKTSNSATADEDTTPTA